MKTYSFDEIESIKSFSDEFKTSVLCRIDWIIFSKAGKNELYSFKTDGRVDKTINGIGKEGKWEWMSDSDCLILNFNNNIIRLHFEYAEKSLMVFRLDGTKKYAVLIDQKNRDLASLDNYTKLKDYFSKRKEQLLTKQSKIKAKNQIFMLRKKAKKVADSLMPWWYSESFLFVLIVFLVLISFGVVALFFSENIIIDSLRMFYLSESKKVLLTYILWTIFTSSFLVSFFVSFIGVFAKRKFESNLEKWKKNNPGNDLIQFINFIG